MKHAVLTTEALLASAGYNYRKWTKHKYSHSELVTLPGSAKGETTTGLGHFFRCAETGELRRWGFEASFRCNDNGGN